MISRATDEDWDKAMHSGSGPLLTHESEAVKRLKPGEILRLDHDCTLGETCKLQNRIHAAGNRYFGPGHFSLRHPEPGVLYVKRRVDES